MKYRLWCSKVTTRALPKYLKPQRKFTVATAVRKSSFTTGSCS